MISIYDRNEPAYYLIFQFFVISNAYCSTTLQDRFSFPFQRLCNHHLCFGVKVLSLFSCCNKTHLYCALSSYLHELILALHTTHVIYNNKTTTTTQYTYIVHLHTCIYNVHKKIMLTGYLQYISIFFDLLIVNVIAYIYIHCSYIYNHIYNQISK